jgi:hypothetical protein
MTNRNHSAAGSWHPDLARPERARNSYQKFPSSTAKIEIGFQSVRWIRGCHLVAIAGAEGQRFVGFKQRRINKVERFQSY